MPPISVDRKYFGQIDRFRTRLKTSGIVIHYTAGRGVENSIATLNTRRSEKTGQLLRLGYHYIISKNNVVYQLADDSDFVQHIRNRNGTLIGIALEASDENDVTEAQAKFAADFVKQKLAEYPFLSTRQVFGHGELQTEDKAKEEGYKVLNLIRGTTVDTNGSPILTKQKIPIPLPFDQAVAQATLGGDGAPVGPVVKPSTWNGGRPVTTPTTPTQPTTPSVASPILSDDYKERVYRSPFRNTPRITEALLLADTPARQYLDQFLSNLVGPNFSTQDGAVLQSQLLILDKPMFDGDVNLIDNITKVQQKRDDEVKSILGDKLRSFSPDAKFSLLSHGIFEVYPDSMRNKMSKNSTVGGNNPNFSHAWRLPNKLSVTADMTIPGVSGLRVGQIFWIDKLGDSYKDYGAFQLFGLSENIDVSKGWTTSIHSRFIALPRRGGEMYLTDKVKSGTTPQQAREGKPQN